MTRQLKLDKRDLQILKILSREGRISKSELAARINLSPTPCWERLKRLEAAGVISGYRAEISLRQIVPHIVVFVAVELERHRAESLQIFERAIAGYEEIMGCWAIGGGFDYLLQIITIDIDEYQQLMDQLLGQEIGLARYYTYIVTKAVKLGGTIPFDKILARQKPKKSLNGGRT